VLRTGRHVEHVPVQQPSGEPDPDPATDGDLIPELVRDQVVEESIEMGQG